MPKFFGENYDGRNLREVGDKAADILEQVGASCIMGLAAVMLYPDFVQENFLDAKCCAPPMFDKAFRHMVREHPKFYKLMDVTTLTTETAPERIAAVIKKNLVPEYKGK